MAAADDEKNAAECLMMSKEESKVIVRTKEFESFMDKTSKMIERALTGSEDILGPSLFLDGLSDALDGEEQNNNNHMTSNNNRDKLVSLFTFMDERQTNRTVTSLQWSPSVSNLSFHFDTHTHMP